MKKVIFEKSILSCVLIFLICCIARVVEYFGIRTDETILAENFIHKVFGIIILVVMLVLSKLSWDSIGFTKTRSAYIFSFSDEFLQKKSVAGQMLGGWI